MYKKKLLIGSNIKIIEALKRLDETADKVLFVADSNARLLGALTDGDIRRHILKGRSLEDDITEVYNKNPKFLHKNECTQEKLKEIFLVHKITDVPILDENNIIVDIVTWDKAFSEETTKHQSQEERLMFPS